MSAPDPVGAEVRARARALPVAEWWTAEAVAPGVTKIVEPHLDPLLQANLWLVEGSERDMLIDSGMGVGLLAPFVDGLREASKPLVHVLSHAHIDHMGGSWEFDSRLIHPAEAADLEKTDAGLATLFRDEIPQAMRDGFEAEGYRPLPDLLIDARPSEHYDPSAYRLNAAPATGLLEEGDRVELGARAFTVIHLPGHSAGGIGLLDEADGTLFSGDAIYDGPLLPIGVMEDYLVTLKRLAGMEVSIVHGGHDLSFGQARMREICAEYLAKWS
ncbi:MBL fold metallo-hydrolase [Albimonas sp. CAU 1670]|uniref:MBL fold metallo-hydrolase n=1 Tax=Albimonas sp. CAU 1670 TaxID=3032599 RepID=UPI0023D9FAE5|nr:MBL fold metallo-hydrolase [Albimonas sp. CAU 1670]MDF2235573.1 MBL fold metallo-hydrolase [Albimonas sp. CAU 1670]